MLIDWKSNRELAVNINGREPTKVIKIFWCAVPSMIWSRSVYNTHIVGKIGYATHIPYDINA